LSSNTSSQYQWWSLFLLFLFFAMSCLDSVDDVLILLLPNMDFFDIKKGNFTIVLNINCIFSNHIHVSTPSTKFVTYPIDSDFRACKFSISCKFSLKTLFPHNNFFLVKGWSIGTIKWRKVSNSINSSSKRIILLNKIFN